MCLTSYTSEGKDLRVQFRFSIVHVTEAQTSLNIILETYFGEKILPKS
jgi:hypothetical protein